MGSFCIQGFASNLQIISGDKIALFICIKDNYNKNIIAPIYSPIIGAYDDYGGIENIECDYSTKKLCEILHCDDLIRFIDLINHQNRFIDDEREEFERIISYINSRYYDVKEGDLCLAIEHYDVYKNLAQNQLKHAANSYNKCIEKYDLFKNWYDMSHNKLMLGNSNNIFSDILDAKYDYDNSVSKWNETMNINPNFDSGYFGNWSDHFGSNRQLMQIFKNNFDLWKDENIKDSFIETMSFYFTLFIIGMQFRISEWGSSENANKIYRQLVKTYAKIVKEQHNRLK